MKKILAIFFCFFLLSAHCQNEKRASKIAALYMYNFLTLIDIPGCFDEDQTEVTVAFLCEDRFSKLVEKRWNKIYVGKSLGSLPLGSTHLSSLDGIKNADMVFISEDCDYKPSEIKKAIGNRPIIYVGYNLPYGEPMINLAYVEESLKFSMNSEYLEANKLTTAPTLERLSSSEIESEKEWKNTIDKLEYELEHSSGNEVKIDAKDLDAIISDYRQKQDALIEIEEQLVFKEVELDEKQKIMTLHDSLYAAKGREIKEQEKKLSKLNADIDNKSEQIGEQASTISNQKTIIVASILFLILAVLGGFLIYRSYRDKKRANAELAEQKRIVDEKNNEITDSINYAKRIQQAILPPPKMMAKYLPNSFVMYKPKDIVAGDFYWLESVGNKVLIAAADCTGHGVPGAMVSVICNNGLNRSVHEYGLTDPAKILDKTREIVIREFEKAEEEVKDGMDIALCSLEGNTLTYAGAHNPLWIIRNGEVLETKADKQPIGKFDAVKPFTAHNIQVENGDQIYIFSDGFVDQFGGEKGKKFKPKNLKALLLSIESEPMQEQLRLLDQAFEKWKGELEQLDDVCMIGIAV